MSKITGPNFVLAGIIILLISVLSPVWADSVDSELGDNEVKLGKESVAEIAKEYKLSDNAADLERVRKIGNKLAEAANKLEVKSLYGSSKVTPFQYTFNIIEDKDVNAFCVPGGFVYVYRGLLDFVQSDQELAGVLAHEITHAAHHHMVYLLKRQASLQNAMAVAMLAAMISGTRSGDVENVLMGAQLYQIAKVNGYGMQAERDADYGAVMYMRQAGYNPVGLLTFMERLAQRPELVDYGIYRNHPLDADRVLAAKRLITDLGLPINRRATTNAISAEMKTDKVGGVDETGVYISGTLIYRPASTSNKTAEQRAQEAVDSINKMLDSDVKMYEIKVDASGAVIARGQDILLVSDADAKLMNSTPQQVADIAATAIRNVLWKQMVDTLH